MESNGTAKRYSEAVKIKVVEELEKGRLTVAQARRQYGIGGARTIQGWIKRYGKAGRGRRMGHGRRGEAERIERLERDKRELEKALARTSVKVAALEALVEEAQAYYGEDFKKNFAMEVSNERRSN